MVEFLKLVRKSEFAFENQISDVRMIGEYFSDFSRKLSEDFFVVTTSYSQLFYLRCESWIVTKPLLH